MAAENGPTKAQKGRFKKLSKRARSIQLNSESGICNIGDWDEFVQLSSTTSQLPSLGPSIHWRCNKPKECVTGSDIRDVIGRLFARASGSSNVKRGADYVDFTTNKLPSWVTLQNPVAAKHVGVVEIQIDNEETMLAIRDSLLSGLDIKGQQCTHSKVRWFDSHPKSISDILLYAASPKPPKPKHTSVKSLTELYHTLIKLKLSEDDFSEQGYPSILGKTSGGQQTMAHSDDENLGLLDFIETAKSEMEKQGRILGIDCEMVKTNAGSELARVTIVKVEEVQANGDLRTSIVWDQLVKPRNPVLDYVTEYSGVTASILEPVAMTLADVHEYLLKNLSAADILIGHSAENDLRALRWIHPTIVDTSVMFRPGHGRHKYSLKNLAAQLLHRKIQQGASHCSAEDAIAAVELACRRAFYGTDFGIHDRKPKNILHQWSKCGTTVTLGTGTWLRKHVTNQPSSTHALDCDTVSHSNAKALSAWLTAPVARRARLAYARWESDGQDKSELTETVTNLAKNRDSSNTILLICLQPALRDAETLHELRRVRLNPKTTLDWTDIDESTWKAAAKLSSGGYMLWIGTKNL